MLPRLCPPIQPFHPAYPRAWFWQLDACLAVNGVTTQPLMHDILLDALPAELRHLSAASSSSPQPYDDLCAAVLARYGETYRPLPGTRELWVSPPPTRAVPPGPQPSHDRDLPSPATSLSTSRPATSAVVPAPDDPPDDVQDPTPEISAPDDVAAATDQTATSRVSSTPLADGPSGMPAIRPSSLSSPAHDMSLTSASTLATLPHDLEADMDNISPAVRPSLAPSTVSEHVLLPTSKLCASCQQRPASPSTSTAAEVRAPYQLRPHLRDAATMTEAPEDDMPAGSPMAEQAAHVTPATSTGFQHPDQRTSPPVPPAEGASTRTGASSEPDMWPLCRRAVPTSASALCPHRNDPLQQLLADGCSSWLHCAISHCFAHIARTGPCAPALNSICQPRSLAPTGPLPKGPFMSSWDPPGHDTSQFCHLGYEQALTNNGADWIAKLLELGVKLVVGQGTYPLGDLDSSSWYNEMWKAG
ncbi:hypothetical protein HPB52_014855 [Rhipicephalus sanguineus]|uniref:Uncharacterized protein n=1 Tax=Rhipicephalus sanguineus TaxID=34632 RepID=A0A9D4PNL9_RHISA|nr:hypothetical protein HPB52_014855 [Rhipicephalus sanguineus]